MFYSKIYDKLISKAKNESRIKCDEIYYENHHIYPRHLGGDDNESNLVLLTLKEHCIAHFLLWKIHNSDGDKLAYKMRSGQTEDAQRLRSKLAVHANRNGGNGFWKVNGDNPMKDPNIIAKAIETKKIKYGSAGIYSDEHLDKVRKGIKLGMNSAESRNKASAIIKERNSKLSKSELSKKYGRTAESNGNSGIIKGYYIVYSIDGKKFFFMSQNDIKLKLNVSQKFLINNRNTGIINNKSRNKLMHMWNGWKFDYFSGRFTINDLLEIKSQNDNFEDMWD